MSSKPVDPHAPIRRLKAGVDYFYILITLDSLWF